MDIQINKAVIHEIVKLKHNPPLPLDPTKDVLPTDNKAVERVLKGVLDLYGKKNNSAQYGVFKTGPNAGRFPGVYDKYVNLENPTDESFLTMSEGALGELHRLSAANPLSTGGYILVADITSEKSRFILVSMLKKKGGVRVNKKHIPEELEQIDLDTIHQAAKINCNKYDTFLASTEEEKKELSYLSFVTPSANKAATGYFVVALGCAKGTASAKATDTLISESVAFFKNNGQLKDKRLKYKDDLMRYLDDCATKKKPAKLSEVDAIARSYFPNDEEGVADDLSEQLHELLNSERNSVPTEFPVNPGTLKRYTHIKYKSENWELLFDKDSLGVTENSEIQYITNEKGEDKIVISRLPANLRAKILEELRDKGVAI